MAGPSSHRWSIAGWARRLLFPCITPQVPCAGSGIGAPQLSPWVNPDPDSESETEFAPGVAELISTYQRQQGQVRAMAFSNDGLLYTGSDSKNIRVWKEGVAVVGFKTFCGPINAIVLDWGGCVYSSHGDGKIRVWQRNPATEGTPYLQLETVRLVQGRLNSVFNRRVLNRSRGSLRHDMPVSCLCLSDCKRFLYSGSWDCTMKTWCIDDWCLVDTVAAHTDKINALAACVDDLVFSASADGSVKMWRREVLDERRNTVRHFLVHTMLAEESTVNALAVGNNMNLSLLYAGSSDGTLRCWLEGRGWEEAENLEWHQAAVTSVAVAQGPLVFSGSSDSYICIWRREQDGWTHALLQVMIAHGGPVNCLAAYDDWEADGSISQWILCCGSEDRMLEFWQVVDPGGQDSDELE